MKTDYSLIPEEIMKDLLDYIEYGYEPESFLYSVLSNNLFKSVFKATDEMKPIIPLLVYYIYNEIPSGCWGSEEIIDNWLEKHQDQEML